MTLLYNTLHHLNLSAHHATKVVYSYRVHTETKVKIIQVNWRAQPTTLPVSAHQQDKSVVNGPHCSALTIICTALSNHKLSIKFKEHFTRWPKKSKIRE